MSRRGDIISRHDRVRDTIMTACSSANLSPVYEQKHLLLENNSRPGDVYLPSFIAGQPAALDVTIKSPLQASLISDAARTCGFALTLAEDRKIGHHYQKCSDMGIHFIPLALVIKEKINQFSKKELFYIPPPFITKLKNYITILQNRREQTENY